MSDPITTVENDVLSILQRVRVAAQRYLVHGAGLAITFLTTATHDLTKWEAVIAGSGTLTLTSLLKRVSAWVAGKTAK